MIKENLKMAGDRQESYVDNRRKDLEVSIRYSVFLRLSPWNGVLQFEKKKS